MYDARTKGERQRLGDGMTFPVHTLIIFQENMSR
jgi:hypothetical protein